MNEGENDNELIRTINWKFWCGYLKLNRSCTCQHMSSLSRVQSQLENKENHSTTGFVSLRTGYILSCIILGCSGWLGQFRVFSRIPGFYRLDVSSTPSPNCDYQKWLQILLNVPWGAEVPLVEDHLMSHIIPFPVTYLTEPCYKATMRP